MRYRDGWSVHAWHRTQVPAWVIEEPTVARIAEESNVEIRAMERLGWGEFIDQAGLRLVSQAPDPGNPGAEFASSWWWHDVPAEGVERQRCRPQHLAGPPPRRTTAER